MSNRLTFTTILYTIPSLLGKIFVSFRQIYLVFQKSLYLLGEYIQLLKIYSLQACTIFQIKYIWCGSIIFIDLVLYLEPIVKVYIILKQKYIQLECLKLLYISSSLYYIFMLILQLCVLCVLSQLNVLFIYVLYACSQLTTI